MRKKRANFLKLLSTFICLAVLLLAIDTLLLQLQNYRWQDVLQGLDLIGHWQLLGALLLTGLSYGAIAAYDLLAFRYIRNPLHPIKVAFAGLITYAISPNVGFAFLTGGALRYRLYSLWKVTAMEIAEVIVFSNLSLWIGVCAIAGAIFSVTPLSIPAQVDIPLGSMKVLGSVFLALAAGYLALAAIVKAPLKFGRRMVRIPSLNLAVGQIAIFACDWGCAAAALYILLDLQGIVGFPQFFGMYVVGLGLGLLSTVPGGVGVFETVMVFLLAQYAAEPRLLAGLLLFRGIYYFLPFALSVACLGGYELRRAAATS